MIPRSTVADRIDAQSYRGIDIDAVYKRLLHRVSTETQRLGMSHTDMGRVIGLEKSLYNKRRRDASAFLAKEFLHVCAHLGISLDAELGVVPPRRPNSSASLPSRRETSYLSSIRDLTESIVRSAQLASAEIVIEASSTDIPVLHFLDDEVLRTLKTYLFRSIEPKFTWPDLNAELREVVEAPITDRGLILAGAPIGRHVEIWGSDPLASLFHQLAYVTARGALEEWAIELVRDRLLAFTERLEARLRAGRGTHVDESQQSPLPLSLYLEDLRGCSAQYVFAVAERTWSVFTYDLPDYLVFPEAEIAACFRQAFAKRMYLAERVSDRDGRPISTFIRDMRATIDERCAALPSARR